MAYVVKPPEGQLPSEGWKNTEYNFFVKKDSNDADTGDPIKVNVPVGTYSWSKLKEEKKRLQDQIDEINIKMNDIESLQSP